MRLTRVGSVLMGSPPWVLVRVFADAGLVGLGEAYHGGPVPPENPQAMVEVTAASPFPSAPARMYGVLMAPHDIGSPVQAVAAGHLACSLPNLLAMEQHFPDLPLWHRLVGDHQLIADGELVVPDRPGLGIRLEDTEVRRHLL